MADYSISILEAHAHIEAIRNLLANASETPLQDLTGYQLYLLLEPVSVQLSNVLKDIEDEFHANGTN